MMLRTSFTRVTVAVFLAFGSVAVGQPEIINLGTLPGHSQSLGLAISSDGSTVAGRSGPFFEPIAFRWTSTTGMENLGTLPGRADSRGWGISGDGSTVVGNSGGRAFRWTPDGGMEDLGNLGSGDPFGSPQNLAALAFDANADGSIVVGYSDSDEGLRAFRWTVDAGMEDLGVGASRAVSADGSVVAGHSNFPEGLRAFRWTAEGGMQNLGTLPDLPHSEAWGLSADGSTVVGVSSQRAFRWTADNGMEDLGTLRELGAIAYAVNGDGSMVVGGEGPMGSPDERAFLWTSELGMVDMNDYLPALGLDLTGWTLSSARGISEDGFSITGWGYYLGQQQAFVVTGIPEPGSLALMGLGALGLLRRRRR